MSMTSSRTGTAYTERHKQVPCAEYELDCPKRLLRKSWRITGEKVCGNASSRKKGRCWLINWTL